MTAALARSDLADLLKDVQSAQAKLETLQSRVLDLAAQGRGEEAVGFWARDSGTVLDEQRRALDSVVGAIDAESDAANAAMALRQQRFASLMIGAFALSVVLTVLIGWLLARSITAPLSAAVAATERLAEGDLLQSLQAEEADEPARVIRALNAASARLRSMIGEVQRSAGAIRVAATQMSVGNQDLSNRTEKQASSLQQTTASMEQISGAVKSNAGSATDAFRLAGDASRIAGEGGVVVDRVVKTMSEIQNNSRRIADITSVIDGIAFQTNILALNASVEAARAGEHGRGFAVVAGEVRTLAQRAAQAAREIKGLISTSVDKVDDGNALVADAGQTMRDVVGQVTRVTELVGQIATTAQAQSNGVSEVTASVTQLDQMTQQNAALVEQSTAAVESLKSMADQLAQALEVFRIDEQQTAVA
jgi:methyl-accepting chemotaxis protein